MENVKTRMAHGAIGIYFLTLAASVISLFCSDCWKELPIEIIVIWEKYGFLGIFFQGDVGFWGKNGVWQVNLHGLGKIGKKKTFKNV
jgi:hypothetical protein